MFMGFTLHFYIIFGTNLLTGGPAQIVVFLLILEFHRKEIPNGVQTEWKLRERSFWNKRDPGDLERTSSNTGGGHESARRAPHPRGPLECPPTYLFLLYIPTYLENIRTDHENLIPPMQPSVSARSHLGAFADTLPKGESTTEGFCINILAPPMSCE